MELTLAEGVESALFWGGDHEGIDCARFVRSGVSADHREPAW